MLDRSAFSAIADLIERDWTAAARIEQLPPPGNNWYVWLFMGAGVVARLGLRRSGSEVLPSRGPYVTLR